MQWKASKACLIIQSHKYVRNLSHSLFLHSRDLVFLALWQPHMHDVWTGGHCRAECISEGLAGYLARFSGQRTNYSGMDVAVLSHAGVTQSSQLGCSTQLESESPADSLRRPQHLVKLLHVRRWSERVWFSEATSRISILFQGAQTLWCKCIRLPLRRGAENESRLQPPTAASRKKQGIWTISHI